MKRLADRYSSLVNVLSKDRFALLVIQTQHPITAVMCISRAVSEHQLNFWSAKN